MSALRKTLHPQGSERGVAGPDGVQGIAAGGGHESGEEAASKGAPLRQFVREQVEDRQLQCHVWKDACAIMDRVSSCFVLCCRMWCGVVWCGVVWCGVVVCKSWSCQSFTFCLSVSYESPALHVTLTGKQILLHCMCVCAASRSIHSFHASLLGLPRCTVAHLLPALKQTVSCCARVHRKIQIMCP